MTDPPTVAGNKIDRLYGEHASFYDLVSHDRDFAQQVSYFRRVTRAGPRVLELFAGPAYHGKEWVRQDPAAVVLCIDQSAEMRAIALKGTELRSLSYEVGRVPEVIPEVVARFQPDVALMARYSAGYLAPKDLHQALGMVRESLRPGGVVVLELHSRPGLEKGLCDLAIRRRSVVAPGGSRITCTWPAGEIRWSTDGTLVEMDVVLEVERRTGIATYRYISTEWVHEAVVLAKTVAGYSAHIIDSAAGVGFPGCDLLVLEKRE